MTTTIPRAGTKIVRDMILDVLDLSPDGLILVQLHVSVDAALVNQRICLSGCEYGQLRYALLSLVKDKLVLARPADERPGRYVYHIKPNAFTRQAPPRRRARKSTALPDRKLSPMEFAGHVLSQIPAFWDYAQAYPECSEGRRPC